MLITAIKRFARRYLPGLRRTIRDSWKKEHVAAIVSEPLNPGLHLEYAHTALKRKRAFLAYAEFKTAKYLGADAPNVNELERNFQSALPDMESMGHNQYFRLKSLANEIRERSAGEPVSVLDVGGGEGWLAAFIPEARYCLVEPKINGVSGENLPFPDGSFDFVVACHVLEHIPVNVRERFLDQLLSKSRRGVILLNPFDVEGTLVDERLRLVIETIDSLWAKEHLECALPKIEDLETYARERGLDFCSKPNGAITTSLAFVFMQHFARESGHHAELKKIDRFFNREYMQIMDSEKYPNAYVVYLRRREFIRGE